MLYKRVIQLTKYSGILRSKVISYPNQKHPGCKKSCGQELKKGQDEKDMKSKNGGQGQCSDSADGNKILIITIQATKYWVFST